MTDQKELEQETTDIIENDESSSVDVDLDNDQINQTTQVPEDEALGDIEETQSEDANSQDESIKSTDQDSEEKLKEATESDSRSDRSWSKWKRDKRNRDNNRPKRRQEWEKKEFEERMLEVRRVTRVTTWWRQLSFRATILVWNKKGKIGLGVAKWNDVQSALSKATYDAYKNIVNVTINDNWSVPYPIETKYKSAYIKLIPALPGTWLKAGASVRQVLELAWYTNILSKILWTNNKLNNALLAISILSRFKNFWHRFNLKKQVEKIEENSKNQK